MEKIGKILGECMPQGGKRKAGGDGGKTRSISVARTRESPPVTQGVGNSTAESTCEDQSAEESEREVRKRPAVVRRRRLGAQSDLTRVKGILSKVLAFRGLDKRLERYEFILRWHEIVGERLAEVSKPEYIRNKVLVVQVLHSVWAQELTMIKPVLLQSLAQYLKPGDIVRDMVFKVGDQTYTPSNRA